MDRRSRVTDVVFVCLLLASVCAILSALSGCGPSMKQKALRNGMVVLNASLAGAEEYDRAHQIELIGESESGEEAREKLAAYRGRRELVITVFVAAYRALAMAAMDPTDLNVTNALKIVEGALETVKEFKNHKSEAPEKLDLHNDSDDDADEYYEYVYGRGAAR
jgi:hypothetical protein